MVWIVAIGRRDGNADACPYSDVMAVELERCADRFDDPLRQRGGVLWLQWPHLHNGELVAAQPRHRVRVSDAASEALGDSLEQGIPDGMAERVVDLFEAIEIKTEHCQPFFGPRVSQGIGETIAQEDAIG